MVHGLNNTKALISTSRPVRWSTIHEVMACPGGCIGGAGQPVDTGEARKGPGLYRADKGQQLRRSTDNPLVARVYEKG